jgi:hypothetical protein
MYTAVQLVVHEKSREGEIPLSSMNVLHKEDVFGYTYHV